MKYYDAVTLFGKGQKKRKAMSPDGGRKKRKALSDDFHYVIHHGGWSLEEMMSFPMLKMICSENCDERLLDTVEELIKHYDWARSGVTQGTYGITFQRTPYTERPFTEKNLTPASVIFALLLCYYDETKDGSFLQLPDDPEASEGTIPFERDIVCRESTILSGNLMLYEHDIYHGFGSLTGENHHPDNDGYEATEGVEVWRTMTGLWIATCELLE